ncbi:CPBP family intramembrane glutamic endopeptidase [Leeuwenhoekiella parthenopeia]|uniref:CPBP family intramembrane metalloprotease n=1 Tax=Leeuwenhoekiella parthenopeia TaxID=2890320 RepID=A0ABS8GQ44_9FLAO|nr:type II CAAX endopeptidase family protein [Leeuwenhoekiella parthenopeia]MCC4211402.1 CPBP family intramembrane metalloprotease [Leeuwenhoekiella parthenopeia]
MEEAKRGWLRILLFVLPYIFIAGGVQLLGAYLMGIDFQSEDKTYFDRFFLKLFELVGMFLVLWIFMNYVDKRPFVDLGFSWKGRSQEFLAGIVLGAVIMGFVFVFLLLTRELIFKSVDFDASGALASILLFTAVAVGEEVLLRGYVLRNLMLSFSKYSALALSSLLFAALHGLNPNLDVLGMLNLFLAGILLGTSYIFTKNLWFPIGLHLSWNLFQSYFGFNVSGQDFYSIFKFELPEANILNGGYFGFEGSVLAVIIQLLLIGLLFSYYQKRRQNSLI